MYDKNKLTIKDNIKHSKKGNPNCYFFVIFDLNYQGENMKWKY